MTLLKKFIVLLYIIPCINWQPFCILYIQDKIGWRNKARRMLIYASDVDYHFAGDGKVKHNPLNNKKWNKVGQDLDTQFNYCSSGLNQQINNILCWNCLWGVFLCNDCQQIILNKWNSNQFWIAYKTFTLIFVEILAPKWFALSNRLWFKKMI